MLNKITRTIVVLTIVVLSLFIGKTTVNTTSAATLACVDSDNGNFPNVFGVVTTSSPALPEIVNDVCLNADPVLGTGKWNQSVSGTHVQEGTCVNSNTGEFALTVHLCEFGCNNGACNPAPQSYSVTNVKVEGKGIISKINNNQVVINNITAHYNSATIIKLNYQPSLMVDQKVEYKGFKNTDGSITLTKIEINR